MSHIDESELLRLVDGDPMAAGALRGCARSADIGHLVITGGPVGVPDEIRTYYEFPKAKQRRFIADRVKAAWDAWAERGEP